MSNRYSIFLKIYAVEKIAFSIIFLLISAISRSSSWVIPCFILLPLLSYQFATGVSVLEKKNIVKILRGNANILTIVFGVILIAISSMYAWVGLAFSGTIGGMFDIIGKTNITPELINQTLSGCVPQFTIGLCSVVYGVICTLCFRKLRKSEF